MKCYRIPHQNKDRHRVCVISYPEKLFCCEIFFSYSDIRSLETNQIMKYRHNIRSTEKFKSYKE